MPDQNVRAWVLEREGAVVGIAGYTITGDVPEVFSDSKEQLPSAVIWRESVAMMRRLNFPAICRAEKGSGRFLRRLGWVSLGQDEDGEVYGWQL